MYQDHTFTEFECLGKINKMRSEKKQYVVQLSFISDE